jgi:hypothetical protein
VTDRLLSAALERIPPQLEAPQETRESLESPGPTIPYREAGEGPQTDTRRPQRPFWRRIFGS